MQKVIDVRSDTVTQPTAKMRKAMSEAIVGDSIMGEDPTVNQLEAMGAQIFGKEAGLFVTSGTMANQIAVMVFCRRGDEIILGSDTHMLNLEVGGLSALSGVQPRVINVPRGYYDPQVVEKSIQPPGIQLAETSLICIENTYDLNKGFIVQPENMREIATIGEKYAIPIYMDGARIFNSAAACDSDVKIFAQHVDALQVCLTKGLAAPFGSLLIGSKTFIDRARLMKQRLGGGMRQAGIMAAAAIVALKEMRERLSEDHKHAKLLAQGLLQIDSRLLNIEDVETNVLTIDVAHLGVHRQVDGDAFLQAMSQQQVKIKKIGDTTFRMITHYHITEVEVEAIVGAVAHAVKLFS